MLKTRIRPQNPNANMKRYYDTYHTFSWNDVEQELGIAGCSEINIVSQAIDRWADDPKRGNKPALIFDKGERALIFSYKELKEKTCQWANFLVAHGFEPGDRLLILLPPCPEIYLAMIACARLGAIFTNIYPRQTFDELEWILFNAEPKAVLTDPDLVELLSHEGMERVGSVLLTGTEQTGMFPQEAPLEPSVGRMPKDFTTRLVAPETPLYLLYTSGSTGPPKGVVHAHGDMVGHYMTARYVLDLQEDSILWTDGDSSWVTGTVYGAFAPWLCGATSVIQGQPFSASSWYRTLEKHRVSVWYTTPSTIRRLMEAGDDLPQRYDFSHLRHIASVGDALIPDLFFWVKEHFKLSPHDTWWMTETGMICIANFPSEPIKPGSMGRPVPGIKAASLDANGEPLPILTLGELALQVGWPSLMKALWRDEERYKLYFRNGWFLTGDVVIKDEDGYYYHQGRNDDLIKVGEKLMGPYEIEQTLRLHPAVAEAAAIAKTAGKGKVAVKAFVRLNTGLTRSARLNHEIRAFLRANLHEDVPLAEIEFVEDLPKTRSGKLLRRVLRARELGLPSGDPSKLQE